MAEITKECLEAELARYLRTDRVDTGIHLALLRWALEAREERERGLREALLREIAEELLTLESLIGPGVTTILGPAGFKQWQVAWTHLQDCGRRITEVLG